MGKLLSRSIKLTSLRRSSSKRSPEDEIVLELDWGYELNQDQIIEAIILSSRDITEVKQLRLAQARQERGTTMIIELLRHQQIDFKKFYENVVRFTDENLRLIEVSQQYSQASLKLMFINVHTLKGHARYLGLSYLKDRSHEIESHYSLLKNNEQEWDSSRLAQDMNDVRSILEEYQTVSATRLGWSFDEKDYVAVDSRTLVNLIEYSTIIRDGDQRADS